MANRTVSDVITDINAIFMTIPGIVRAFTEAPDVPPSASGDLPCVIPLVQGAVPTQEFDLLRKVYTIRYLLLVTPGGKGLVSAEKQARPFIDSVIDTFFAHVKLGDANLDHGQIKSMNYMEITYAVGGTSYIGYEVIFEVTNKYGITLVA